MGVRFAPLSSISTFRLTTKVSLGADRLFESFVGISEQVEQEGIRVQVDLVSGLGHDIGNVSGCVDSPELHESGVLLHGLSNQFGGFGFSLGLGDDGLLLLDGSQDNVLGTFGILLSCKCESQRGKDGV